MGVWDIHNSVPLGFKPRWGQLSLKIAGEHALATLRVHRKQH